MVTEIKSPTYPESVADGTIANWVKKEGQAVKQDELIAEIETDKIVLEVLSPINGKISKILKPEGEVVNSGELIAQIEETSSHTEEEDQEDSLKENVSSKNENNSLNHGPAVRRMLEEYNLDPKNITGSGKDGRISKSDIKNYLENINKKPKKPIEKDISTSSGLTDRDEERVPMSRMRSTIAKRLLSVTQETAMLTTFNEVDMKPIKDLRKKFGDEFQTEHGLKLGFMGFFVSASINALKKFPVANASIDGTDVIYHGYQDISVAVSTDRGLVVPVIRDADILTLPDIEKSILEYSEKAKEGKLSIEDMQGGTFTISNGGVFGSLLSTPILNAPQTAILGMHTIQDRVVVIEGEMKIRPMMYLALSYDHRLLDGKDAVAFLICIKEQLESPQRLLLNL
ncbi:2-oxoglutarate dehydrogenase complex dihydrolipoyllysine-residue succinyltransferase [Hyphomicrobiales bacterium]|nr:2-oxoglutarate dehydrogenase complex dihydrolipoyllysine-residue succinyltransferase [Hyphomicrobiales bacterium]